MTFCHKEGKFFLFNKGSCTVLKSDYHVFNWLQYPNVNDYSYFKFDYHILEKEILSSILQTTEKVNLWPPIKHSNLITSYSTSYGLEYQMGQV